MEAIGVAIVVLIWVVSSLIKGFKWLLRQTNPAPSVPAPPPSAAFPPAPAPFQSPYPAAPRPVQPVMRPPATGTLQEQMERLEELREMRAAADTVYARQPQAGGPAVYAETDRRDFERQESALFASEPAALGVSLTTTPAAGQLTSAPNALFGGTDDLIRAMILQEVLGPPLSRRPSSLPRPANTP